VSDIGVILSDMASQRITVRVPKTLGTLLRDRSRAKGQTPSDLVRIALEAYLVREGASRSAYEMAEEAGLIGCARRAPKDLSTNRRYLEGFGKKK
jgi:metal-responsive CopG/Arc/MetJ family transcriptional regulator